MKPDPYSRESLAALDRRDVECGLQIRLLVFEAHRARYLGYLARARTCRSSKGFTPGAGAALSTLWLALADTALDEALAEARTVAKIVDFLTGDEARVSGEIERMLERARGCPSRAAGSARR